MSDLQNITNDLIRKLIETEEHLLKDILKQILKREATNEDAKEIQRIKRRADDNWYILSFRGITLGKVTFDYPDFTNGSGKFGVTFEPDETFK